MIAILKTPGLDGAAIKVNKDFDPVWEKVIITVRQPGAILHLDIVNAAELLAVLKLMVEGKP